MYQAINESVINNGGHNITVILNNYLQLENENG